jgi:hypothetical protein
MQFLLVFSDTCVILNEKPFYSTIIALNCTELIQNRLRHRFSDPYFADSLLQYFHTTVLVENVTG